MIYHVKINQDGSHNVEFRYGDTTVSTNVENLINHYIAITRLSDYLEGNDDVVLSSDDVTNFIIDSFSPLHLTK